MVQNRFLLLFGMLYLGQGGLSSYISYFQKPYLAGEGVAAGSLGVLTVLVSLPFAIKVFFGLITDRCSWGPLNTRWPWIAGGIVCSAVAFLGATAIRPSDQLMAYTALMGAMVFSIALADTATDALAVEAVPPADHANVQAAMTGSRAIGAMVASALVGLLVARFGYSLLMPAMAFIALLPLPFVVWLAPRSRIADHGYPPLRTLLGFFDRSRLRFAFYAVVMSLGLSGTMGLVTLFMHSNLGAGSAAIGGYGMLTSAGTLLGALVYALARRCCGVASATVLGQIALALLAFALSAQQSVSTVTLLGVIVGTVYGYVLTGVLEMTMSRADLAFAGTSFALLISMFNVGGSIGDGLATAATASFGFTLTFQLLAVISIVSIIPLLSAHGLHRLAAESVYADAVGHPKETDR